ncbi:hypothetical protein [Nocardia sp. CC227C]|uniref:hypothetical protein n=1 Tax=Nocardia sp. CC227C TaxID=3044562 RepID=UPI00278C1D0A|nr:hypothetical protein [Nocardia sp. CC227C]
MAIQGAVRIDDCDELWGVIWLLNLVEEERADILPGTQSGARTGTQRTAGLSLQGWRFGPPPVASCAECREGDESEHDHSDPESGSGRERMLVAVGKGCGRSSSAGVVPVLVNSVISLTRVSAIADGCVRNTIVF